MKNDNEKRYDQLTGKAEGSALLFLLVLGVCYAICFIIFGETLHILSFVVAAILFSGGSYLRLSYQYPHLEKIYPNQTVTQELLTSLTDFHQDYISLKAYNSRFLSQVMTCIGFLLLFTIVYFCSDDLRTKFSVGKYLLILSPGLFALALILYHAIFILFRESLFNLKLFNLDMSFEMLDNFIKKQCYTLQATETPADPFKNALSNTTDKIPLEITESTTKKIDLTRPTRINPRVLDQSNSNIIHTKPIAEDDFAQHLQHFLKQVENQILRRHHRQLSKFIEIFEYIKKQSENKNLIKAQNKFLEQQQQFYLTQLQHIVEHYLKYSKEQRMRYADDIQTVPDLWLNQQLNDQLDHLLHDIEFLYVDNLQDLKDHQEFLTQKFNPVEDEFEIIKKDP